MPVARRPVVVNADLAQRSAIRLELQFQHALGAVLLNIEASGPEIENALNEALRIAEDLNDTDYKLRILW